VALRRAEVLLPPGHAAAPAAAAAGRRRPNRSEATQRDCLVGHAKKHHQLIKYLITLKQ